MQNERLNFLEKRLNFLENEIMELKMKKVKRTNEEYEQLKACILVICNHVQNLEEKNKGILENFKFYKNKTIFEEIKEYGIIRNNQFHFTLNED
ncbi:hypothetical protein G3L11_001707 [Campylobacter jejuni]|nr:hypothetical protein [Campylobacter jejuni]EAK2198234.1 hypothetical protein [Campylobacter jejuni]EAL1140851.1 hypothetical protein [Campylobacter jejuni]EDP8440593.1 hypothetical protein [Campylobacter jejuni]EIT4688758.1 hypothetical protein [Campylobacter jejuni]